jgi:hypothetical protein
MRKRGSIVCKLCPCLPKGPTNSTCMRTLVAAALQQQYLQTELILWIRLALCGRLCAPILLTSHSLKPFTLPTVLTATFHITPSEACDFVAS